MKPDTHTVKQLFERDIRYQVPLYQRPYVWNEEEQWAPLWDDLSVLLNHQESGSDVELWSHFLGAIVLDQEKTGPGRIPRYTVIDGQQRLTTLQLLIAAVAKAAATAGADRDAKLLRRLVENDPLEVKDDELLKVWPTNANRASFAAMMCADGPPLDHVNDAGNLIDEAFEYFTTRATEYLHGSDTDDDTDEKIGQGTVRARAELLRITLCDLLKVVSITLESDDNAQVIFETLNARGTPLLSLDLVKNTVFRQVAVQGQDTDALYDQVWRPQLDDEYWRQERRQGRLNRPIGELFLMHWLVMKLERVIPATELFSMFRQGILKPGLDAETLIRELCRDAEIMRSFDALAAHTPEGQFFARLLGPLDASTVLPLVLLLFRSSEIAPARRRRALAMIESWLARRALLRMTTRSYSRFLPRLIAPVKADLVHADEALYAALRGTTATASRWPTDQEFVDRLVTRDAYDVVRRDRLVMALAAVESSLHTNKTEATTVPRGLSLEHLLPREWAENWPLPDVPELHDRRNAAIHKLGNLTIVTAPLNSTMSNAPWRTKRTQLNKHSVLLLNARLAEREDWDEAAIEERGRWLATQLANIWPGPNSATWKGPA
jgi:hypothetical protein